MPSLLTTADKDAIRLALQDVTDTFMVTPVVYSLRGDSIDRFNEDRWDESATAYNFGALAEYSQNDSDKIQKATGGALSTAEIMLTAALSDLKTIGLVDSNNVCIGNPTKDYFTVNGQKYRVAFIGYDGPLDQKNVLVLIFGNREKNNS